MLTSRIARPAFALAIAAGMALATLPSRPAHACSTEPMLGTVCLFAGNFAPRGYALANGQLLPISQYSALFSILGTTYGGDGRTNFALPDLRGRVPLSAGQGAGLPTDYKLGSKGGVESVALTYFQVPNHKHDATATMRVKSVGGTGNDPTGRLLAMGGGKGKLFTGQDPEAADGSMHASAVEVTVDPTGGGLPHENRSPYLTMHYIIATQGVYPSRN